MLSKSDQIESSALKIGVLVNLIMAIAGWVEPNLIAEDIFI